jgi:hypothetical protein
VPSDTLSLQKAASTRFPVSSLQAIERRFGRVRGLPSAARTLDLDILAMGDLVRDPPDPILPHTRAHLRGFALLPLRDVAPAWVEAPSGFSVQAWIDRVSAADRQACDVVAISAPGGRSPRCDDASAPTAPGGHGSYVARHDEFAAAAKARAIGAISHRFPAVRRKSVCPPRAPHRSAS